MKTRTRTTVAILGSSRLALGSLGLLALAGCPSPYTSQAELRMRELCSMHQSWCENGLVVLNRLPPAGGSGLPLLEIERLKCDDLSGGGTSLQATVHLRNYGTGTFDNAHDVNMTATLSDDGQRILNKVVATLMPHTRIAVYGQAMPSDPTEIPVSFDFGDLTGNAVREVTVSFDADAEIGVVRLNDGTLSWPVWNDPHAVAQTALVLAMPNCAVSAP